MPTHRNFIAATSMVLVGRWSIGHASSRTVPLYPVEICRKWGYMDRTAQVLIQPQFDMAWTFSEELAAVRIGRLWGYIARDGSIAIRPQFDEACNFCYGLSPSAPERNGASYESRNRLDVVVPHQHWRRL